jgi:hypothetical protein
VVGLARYDAGEFNYADGNIRGGLDQWQVSPKACSTMVRISSSSAAQMENLR